MRPPLLSVWPPLPPRAWTRGPRPLPYPLTEPGCRLYSRARHGLWQGVRALGLGPGDEVLVPAYHHGSEVEALARAGLGVRFYDADERLAPAERSLELALGERTRALHLIHYLGFPQDAARWRAWADERGLLLLEDAAQAWLAHAADGPVGSHGDLAIFCLYKSVGVPDGAALRTRAEPLPPDTPEELGAVGVLRKHALWLGGRSGLPAEAAARLRRGGPAPYVAADDFALGEPATPPAPLSRFLLPRLRADAVAEARRQRYRFLLDRLGEHVPTPFADLAEGASPFAFPLEVKGKEKVVAALAERGVRPLDFWSVPHPALPAGDFPAAARRRARTVALPVHQELRRRDLERVAAAAAAALAR